MCLELLCLLIGNEGGSSELTPQISNIGGAELTPAPNFDDWWCRDGITTQGAQDLQPFNLASLLLASQLQTGASVL